MPVASAYVSPVLTRSADAISGVGPGVIMVLAREVGDWGAILRFACVRCTFLGC